MYESYRIQWVYLKDTIEFDHESVNNVLKPLSLSGFLKVWKLKFPYLKVFRGGSYYCDYCTTTKDVMQTLNVSEKLTDTKQYEVHRSHAENEFKLYISTMEAAKTASNPN